MEAPPALSRYQREVDEYLRSVVSGSQPALLYRMMRYHLGWEDESGAASESAGKGLRPALCLLACEASGGESRAALPAAAAVELVHNFSLVHDDVQDRDRERRHRPTVWSLWGEAQAINAGDALLALAHIGMLRLADESIDARTVIQAVSILNERTLEMVSGQTLDLQFEDAVDIDLTAYLTMVEKKSGALFDCALHLGGLLGSGRTDVGEALGICGRHLGVAFQIRDDMLGIWGAENRTGKQPAADVRRRKKSLPVVYTLAQSEGAMQEQLRSVYSGEGELDDDSVSFVLRCLDAVQAQAFCARLAGERKRAALADLDELDLTTEGKRRLIEVAEFLLERDF